MIHDACIVLVPLYYFDTACSFIAWFKFSDVMYGVLRMSMQSKTRIQHVALEYASQQQADVFFLKILAIPKVKSTMLSQELCASIFQIEQPVQMETYDNGTARFEVFLTPEPKTPSYAHIGVEIDSKADFLIRCREQGLNPFFVEKQGKQLLFVRDFSENLFEVIEKQTSHPEHSPK